VRRLFALALVVASSAFGLQTDDVSSGFVMAEASGRHLFVFVKTDRCGWCERMLTNTLTDTTVLRILDTRFIWTTLNPETDGDVYFDGHTVPAARFARAFGVSGYPSSLFFESDGTFVGRLPGYMPPDEFSRVLEYVADRAYRVRSSP
jgi:thioredoxin-related protein